MERNECGPCETRIRRKREEEEGRKEKGKEEKWNEAERKRSGGCTNV